MWHVPQSKKKAGGGAYRPMAVTVKKLKIHQSAVTIGRFEGCKEVESRASIYYFTLVCGSALQYGLFATMEMELEHAFFGL